jgi:hypothetical protein
MNEEKQEPGVRSQESEDKAETAFTDSALFRLLISGFGLIF